MLPFKIPLLSLGGGRAEAEPPKCTPRSPVEDGSGDENAPHAANAADPKSFSPAAASPPSSCYSSPGPEPAKLLRFEDADLEAVSDQAATPEAQRESSQAPLDTGDVVTFRCSEGLLVMQQEDRQGEPHFVLRASAEVGVEDPRAHLEVVRQGGYLGFRSAAASGRFLQARRKAGPPAFFNTHLGVWEQWELASALPDRDWHTASLTLRSRQMQQVLVAVEVHRVGRLEAGEAAAAASHAAGGGGQALARPRHHAVATDESVDLTQLALQQFLGHFQREQQSLAVLDTRLQRVRREADDTRAWMVQQLREAKAELLGGYAALRDALAATEGELLRAWHQRGRGIRFALAGLRRAREAAAARQAMAAWRLAAGARKEQQLLVARHQTRWQLARLAGAQQAWRAHARVGASLAANLRTFVERRASAASRAAFGAWRALAERSRWLAERGAQLAARRRARLAQAGLQAFGGRAARSRLQADLAQCLAEKQAGAALRQALAGWRQATAEARQQEVAAEAMRAHRLECLQRAALAHWHARVSELAAAREAAGRMAGRAARRAAGAAFGAWAAAVWAERETARLVAAFQRRRAGRLLSACCGAWAGAAEAGRAARLRAGELRAAGERRRLRALLQGWAGEGAIAAAASAEAAAMTRRKGQAAAGAALRAWRLQAEGARELAGKGARLARRHARSTLGSALAGWREGTADEAQARAEQQAAEAAAAAAEAVAEAKADRLLARCNQRRASAVLSHWSHAASARVERRHAAARVLEALRRRLKATALAAWREAAGGQRAQRAALQGVQRLLRRKQLRRLARAWRDAAEQAAGDRLGVEAAAASQADAGIVGRGFQAWKQAAADSREAAARLARVAGEQRWALAAPPFARQLQTAALAEARAAGGGLAAAAFAAWLQHTQEKRALQRLWVDGVHRMSHVRLGNIFAGWQGSAVVARARRHGLAALQDRVALDCQREAFAQWITVVREKQRAQDDLRRCLLHKRLAIQQLEMWAWRHAQAETQAALNAVFSERTSDLSVTVTATPQPAWRAGRFPVLTPVPPLRELPGPAAVAASRLARGGSLSARGLPPGRSPYGARVAAGAMTARDAAASRELDAEIAALRPRVSSAFRRAIASGANLLKGAQTPLPSDASVSEGPDDGSEAGSPGGSSAASTADGSVSTFRASAERSEGSPALPPNFSPLQAGMAQGAAHAPQVHFYDRDEVVAPETSPQPLLSEASEAGDGMSFVTAWEPNTPADLRGLTPGHWAGSASGSAAPKAPAAAGPTPPPFHAGLLQRLSQAEESPYCTPGPEQPQ